MIRRLPAVAGVCASLLAATMVLTPVADAAPGDPNQVALVVDYPNGTTRSFCVGYRSGMTGADVLAVASPEYGTGPYAGFVLQIGGRGTVPPTDDDYWAYWVTSSGRLVYSGAGVTSTHPGAGTVEAWHWNSSGGKETPSGGSYAALCPNGFATTPPPASSAPTPTGVAAPPAAEGSAGPGGSGTTAGPTSAGSATPRGSGSSTTPAGSGTASPTAPRSTTPSGATSSSPPTGRSGSAGASGALTSVAASDVAARTGSSDSGTGTTVGLLVAVLAVVAFAVLAVLARRRRADQD